VTSTGLLQLSTSSVTLIDVNKVITAGHCHTPSEALNSSGTFDYFTNRDGSRPAGYNPKFIKVKAVLAHHYDSVGDLSLLQPAEAPVRIPVLQMRPIRRVSASRCLASIIRTAWFTVTPRDNSVLRKTASFKPWHCAGKPASPGNRVRSGTDRQMSRMPTIRPGG
jgi:hypothetical protein